MVEKDAEWTLTENVIRKERELSALEMGDDVADGAFSSCKWALVNGLSGSDVEGTTPSGGMPRHTVR